MVSCTNDSSESKVEIKITCFQVQLARNEVVVNLKEEETKTRKDCKHNYLFFLIVLEKSFKYLLSFKTAEKQEYTYNAYFIFLSQRFQVLMAVNFVQHLI